MSSVRTSRAALLLVAVISAAAVQRCAFPEGILYACEDDGSCPDGLTCDPDNVCVPIIDDDDGGDPDAGDGGPDGGDAGDGGDGGGDGGDGGDAGEDAGVPHPEDVRYRAFEEADPYTEDGLVVEHPVTGRVTLNAVFGTTTRDVWVAGAGGRLLHWNGQRWQRAVGTSSGDVLRGLWGAGGAWYAVGDDGLILAWDTDGGRFEAITNLVDPSVQLRGVSGHGGTALAVGDGGTLVVLSGAGNSVEQLNPGSGPPDFLDVWSDAPGSGVLVGQGGALGRYAGPDNYQALDSTVTTDLVSIDGLSADMELYAAGADNVLLRGYVDPEAHGEAGWSRIGVDPGISFTSVAMESDGAWLGRDAGVVVQRFNAPADFASPSIRTSLPLHALWRRDAGTVFGVGADGVMVKTDPEIPGGGFEYFPGGVIEFIRDIEASADGGRIFAVGEGSTLLERRGDQWFPVHPSGAEGFHAVFVGPESVWTAGDSILRHLPDGSVETELFTTGGRRLYDLWGPGDEPLYAVGEEGLLLRRSPQGQWDDPRTGGDPVAGTLRAVEGIAGSDVVWFVAQEGPAYSIDGGGDVAAHPLTGSGGSWDLAVPSKTAVLIAGPGKALSSLGPTGFTRYEYPDLPGDVKSVVPSPNATSSHLVSEGKLFYLRTDPPELVASPTSNPSTRAVGVGSTLWIYTHSGLIYRYDVPENP